MRVSTVCFENRELHLIAPFYYIADEVFAGLLNYQRGKVVSKKTGLVDGKQLRVLLNVADRLYKFSSRSTARRKVETD